MNPATKTRPKAKADVLAQVTKLEKAAQDAEAEADARGTESAVAEARFTELEQAVAALYRRDPNPFTPQGRPLKATSEAGKLVKELDGADPGEAQAAYRHAREIERVAKESLGAFISAHFRDLVEAVAPEGEAASAELQRRGQALLRSALEYHGLGQRINGWRAAAAMRAVGPPQRELQGMRIVGVDHGAELVRSAEQFSAPIPWPTDIR